MLYTVRDLFDGTCGVNVRVRVISKEKPRKAKTRDGVDHTVVETIVGDRTGIIRLSLWDDWFDKIEENEIIDIANGYVNRFKGRLWLNIGENGIVEKAEEVDFPTIEEINARVEQIRRRRFSKRGGANN